MSETVLTAISTAFSTAISSIATQYGGYIQTALPVALGIVGTYLALRLAMRFFKGVAK